MIGVLQYHNITPVSALETPDQVTPEPDGLFPRGDPRFFVERVRVDWGVGAGVVVMSRCWVEENGTSVLGTH